jgi:Universal stress protein family
MPLDWAAARATLSFLDRSWHDRVCWRMVTTAGLGKISVVDTGAQRRAEIESIFRQVNEEIEQCAEEHGLNGGRIPFICECEDERCTAIVPLTPSEYEQVRREPKQFLVKPGHESEPDRVVIEADRFTVVEKTGDEGLLVAPRDPCSRLDPWELCTWSPGNPGRSGAERASRSAHARAAKIVVGYDRSEGARWALDRAAGLCGYGSLLTVVSVARSPSERERIGRLLLEASDELIAAARDKEADLLVVGNGKTRLERALHGSVSSSLIRRAPCDVLVVCREAAVPARSLWPSRRARRVQAARGRWSCRALTGFGDQVRFGSVTWSSAAASWLLSRNRRPHSAG